jgi:hypothetical protein
MSDDFLAVIKLTTGEELVAKVSYLDDEDKLLIECPALMNTTTIRSFGVSVVKVEPWIKTGKETTYILGMDKIITISEVFDRDINKLYSKFVMSYYYDIELPKKKNSISKDMGYVSSVSDARATLEKIFKNS